MKKGGVCIFLVLNQLVQKLLIGGDGGNFFVLAQNPLSHHSILDHRDSPIPCSKLHLGQDNLINIFYTSVNST